MREPPATDAVTIGPPLPSARQSDASKELQAKTLADIVRSILARPLFAPSRRPAAVAIAGPGIAEPPRLAGVIIAADAHLALFAPAEGKVMAVAIGGNVGSYVVNSVSPNAVVLSGPSGERELHPSYVHVTPHVIHAQQEASAP
jgi:general secretion pathway protein N